MQKRHNAFCIGNDSLEMPEQRGSRKIRAIQMELVSIFDLAVIFL